MISRDIIDSIAKIIRAISDINSCRNIPEINSIGLEARMAFAATETEWHDTGFPDNDYWKMKCRAIFLRPPVEPIAVSYWPIICSNDIPLYKSLNIASALTVNQQVIRNKEIIGRSKNGDVLFEPHDKAIKCFDRIKVAYKSPSLRDSMPIYIYASTLMAHPFSDGNGRISRLLFMGAIARLFNWNAPMIGLAPSFYRRGENMAVALSRLSNLGDWNYLAGEILLVLEDCLIITSLLKQLSEDH